MVISGRVFGFWFLIVFAATMLVCMYRSAKLGKIPRLRKMPSLGAIEEAVGRATEMGRPVHFSPGTGGVSAITLAGIALLGYTARTAARYNCPLVVSVCGPDVFTIAEETVSSAFKAEGKPDALKTDTVRYLADQQFPYAAALFGLISREKPAANLMLGLWEASSVMIAECAATVGAIQIAGTTNLSQIPFFVCSCDYTLIGEELMTAGASISQDPVELGSILAQDIAKAGVILIVLAGVVLKLAKNPVLERLLKL